MSGTKRFDRWVLGGVFAFGIAGLLLVSLAAQPEKSDDTGGGSTRVAGARGLKALFEYLERAGLEPSRVETADLAVPEGAALVLVEASLDEGEARVLVDRIREGLSVLIASNQEEDFLWTALDLAVEPDGTAGRGIVAWPSRAVHGVQRVEVDGPMRAILGARNNRLPGAGWVELLADDAGAIAVARRFGAGEVVVLLTPEVFRNEGLPKGNNLRFADSVLRHLAGPSGKVVFDEFHHGYGYERTLTGWLARAGMLPALWLAGLALAADGIRRHRVRVGLPRPPSSPERRAVREFIASYAGLLRASGHRGYAVRALERTMRRRLQDDFGIPYALPPAAVFKRLTVRAPKAAARAYRALERAASLGHGEVGDRDLLDLARDVRAAEAALGATRKRK